MTNTTFNTAIELISQLPLEIQNSILKTVLLNYFLWLRVVNPFPLHQSSGGLPHEDDTVQAPPRIFWDKSMVFQLVSLIGYDARLDDILSLVIQEMQLDVYELDELNETSFEKLANFVLSRSIKVNMIDLRVSDCTHEFLDSSLGMKFLRSGCKKVLFTVAEDERDNEIDMNEHLLLFKEVTFLKLEIRQLQRLYDLDFSLLSSRLDCLSVGTGGTLSVDFLNSIQKDIKKWMLSESTQQKKLILEPCIGFPDEPELAPKFNHYEDLYDYDQPSDEMAHEYIEKLGTFLNKNCDLNIELKIEVCLCDSYPQLVESLLSSLSGNNCCFPAAVSLNQFNDPEELSDVFNWLIRIPDLRKFEISISCLSIEPETTPVINFSSTSIIELNLEYVMCAPERGLSFENLNSLEYLDLYECQVSADFFSHLPDSLRSLSLCNVILISSSDGVKLPIGLERLEYRGDTHKCTLPLISNFNDLTQLHEVAVEKVSSDDVPEWFDFVEYQTALHHVTMQSFITNLPTQIKSLVLHTECSPKRSFEDTMICRSAELLHSFTGLQYLDFECDCHGSFDLCLLPPLMKLKLTVHDYDSFSGHFPSTLKFLDLHGWFQSFQDFWRHFAFS
ncbi:unnamed protein product [Ambrosiozyma monospora]|uniref:Unnamed protein product n=1 Tax=Ambrosiozyma monospora TaxID=43982 RepID=A0A9W6YT98_AMBMO|nr:unnamed protein product [Ambrosiozyma monospora]